MKLLRIKRSDLQKILSIFKRIHPPQKTSDPAYIENNKKQDENSMSADDIRIIIEEQKRDNKSKINIIPVATFILGLFSSIFIPLTINRQSNVNTKTSKMVEFIPLFYDKMKEIDSLKSEQKNYINPYIAVFSCFDEYATPILLSILRDGQKNNSKKLESESLEVLYKPNWNVFMIIIKELNRESDLITTTISDTTKAYITSLCKIIFHQAKGLNLHMFSQFQLYPRKKAKQVIKLVLRRISKETLGNSANRLPLEGATCYLIRAYACLNDNTCDLDLSNFLIGKSYVDGNFRGINFSKANFENTEFTECYFAKCSFKKTNIYNTKFIKCLFLEDYDSLMVKEKLKKSKDFSFASFISSDIKSVGY